MTATQITTGVFAALLACASSGALAQTSVSIPNECRLVENRADGMIVAECPVQANSRTTDFRASAIRANECRSSISARDGVLACNGTTAIVGPLRTSTQQTGIGGFLASVLGAPQPAQEAMDMEWSQGSQPLGQRRADITARIDAGSRDGSLTRAEADAIRRDHDALIRLEAQYAADGQFSTNERTDLATRYAALSTRLGEQRRDDQGYDVGGTMNQAWQPLTERSADFERRVTAARSARAITLAESNRLRSEWQNLMRLEAQYRSNGIDVRESADLDARRMGLERRLGRFADQTEVTNSWTLLETRINTAENNRSLNRNQLARLRDQHGDLVRLDAAWRRIGMGTTEQAYLTRRNAELTAQLEQMQRQR